MENTTLSQRLKELRCKNHYTQAFISSQLNISRATYSNYELGKRMPSLDLVADLAKLYQVPLSHFLTPEDAGLIAAATEPALLSFTEGEIQILSLYRSLNNCRKKQLMDYAVFLNSQV